jgi:hypothetical protein
MSKTTERLAVVVRVDPTARSSQLTEALAALVLARAKAAVAARRKPRPRRR